MGVGRLSQTPFSADGGTAIQRHYSSSFNRGQSEIFSTISTRERPRDPLTTSAVVREVLRFSRRESVCHLPTLHDSLSWASRYQCNNTMFHVKQVTAPQNGLKKRPNGIADRPLGWLQAH